MLVMENSFYNNNVFFCVSEDSEPLKNDKFDNSAVNMLNRHSTQSIKNQFNNIGVYLAHQHQYNSDFLTAQIL